MAGLSRLLTPLVLLAFAACSPAPAHRAPLSSVTQKPGGARMQPTDQDLTATANDPRVLRDGVLVNPETCGMPEKLREPDWPRRLAPLDAREPSPLEPGAATLAVLPDTQYYVSCRLGHFEAQSRWVAANVEARNIAAVLQLGDITESNEELEWGFVKRALSPLQNTVPLILTSGNHDYGEGGSADRRASLFSKHFGKPDEVTAKHLAEALEPGSVENAYFRIEQPNFTLGVLSLEWSPRKIAVDWAKRATAKYPNDRVVFITHAYLFHDSTRYDFATKGEAQDWNPLTYGTARVDLNAPYSAENAAPDGAHDGEMLWNALLKDIPGLFLTLNGHVLQDGEGVLESRGTGGNLVQQVLVNFQMLDEGGLGFLRLVELSPDGRTLRMKTYSPSLERFATGAKYDFSLPIEPPL